MTWYLLFDWRVCFTHSLSGGQQNGVFFTVPCVISSLCKGTNLMLFYDTVMLFEEQAQKSEDLATVPESLA